jgi:hypothetical protein
MCSYDASYCSASTVDRPTPAYTLLSRRYMFSASEEAPTQPAVVVRKWEVTK